MFELVLFGAVLPSSSSAAPTSTSSQDKTSSLGTSDNKSDNNNVSKPSNTSEAEHLFRPVLERLRLLSQKYKSTYLFVHEISLYEIVCLIIRQCLEADQEDCCQDVKVERERIVKLFDGHRVKVKSEDVKGEEIKWSEKVGKGLKQPQTRKMATLRSMLEHIRIRDITGQMVQCMGLLHLWCQYRSKPQYGRITPSDIVIFHHFIKAHFTHILQSAILEPDDPKSADGIVYLVQDQLTLEALNKAIDQVDRAIVKFVFNWPRQAISDFDSGSDAESVSRVPLVPMLMMKSENKKLKPKSGEDEPKLVFREQQEALGRVYLNDYMFRWYGRQCEDLMSQTDLVMKDKDSTELKSKPESLDSLVDPIEPTISVKYKSPPSPPRPQIKPTSASTANPKPKIRNQKEVPKKKDKVKDRKSSGSSKNILSADDDNRIGCAIDRMTFEEKRLLLAKIQSEIKTMTAFMAQSPKETERSLSSLDSFNLSMLESYASDDDGDEDAPSWKTLQLIEALINGGLKSRKRPPFGKGKGALPPPPSKAGQNNKKMPITKAPLPVVSPKGGATAQQKSASKSTTSECSDSTKSAKAFKDDVFGSDYGVINLWDRHDKDGNNKDSNKKTSEGQKKETEGSKKKGQIFQGETASEATDFLMGTSSNSKSPNPSPKTGEKPENQQKNQKQQKQEPPKSQEPNNKK